MVLAEYFFLVLLVLVSYSTYRAKERYFYRSQDSYNKIMTGIVFWLLMLFVRVLAGNGILQHLPVANQAEYHYLTEAFLLVTGGLLLAMGSYEWIASMASADHTSTKYRKYLDLLSSAADSVRKESDPARLQTKLSDLIMHFTGAASVSFYRFDESSGQFAPTEQRLMTTALTSELQQICRDSLRAGHLSIVPFEACEGRKPTVILPLRKAEPHVLLINWQRGVKIDIDLLQVLNLLAAHLAGTAPIAPTIVAPKTKTAEILEELRDDLAAIDRVQEAVNLIDSALRQIMTYDILRIALFDDRGFNVTQHCLGQGRSLLTERNHSISTQKTSLGRLFVSPQVIATDSLDASSYEDDRWLSSCGSRHALTIPITVDGKAVAAVTLASENEPLDKSIGEQIAPALSAAMLPLVRSDSYSHQLVAYNRQVLDLTSTLKKLVSNEDALEFLKELAEIAVTKLPATYCRLWRFDSERETLEFVTDAHSRDVSSQVTRVQSLPLSKTRWHKLAIQAGRMMLINQREERMQMDDQELVESLVVGMQSAILVPMMMGGEPIGIMAIAEMRNWDRRSFSLSDSLFARGLANIAAQALMSLTTAERVGRLNRRIDQLEKGKLFGEVFIDLPKRLATPLTSIMARTQQLIETNGEADEKTTRNLAIIKLQTEKMMNEVRTLQEVRREQVHS